MSLPGRRKGKFQLAAPEATPVDDLVHCHRAGHSGIDHPTVPSVGLKFDTLASRCNTV